MKGYWLALYKKIDSSKNLKEYSTKVTPIIKSFGGKPLVRGGGIPMSRRPGIFKNCDLGIS